MCCVQEKERESSSDKVLCVINMEIIIVLSVCDGDSKYQIFSVPRIFYGKN